MERKWKEKVKTTVSRLNWKQSKILVSAHAPWTSEACEILASGSEGCEAYNP